MLVGQNSTYLLPGQTLEISAGLGAYATVAKPVITIDGQSVSINEYGVGNFKKLITSADTGRHQINVSVSFKDPQTGLAKTKIIMVNYGVFQPPKN